MEAAGRVRLLVRLFSPIVYAASITVTVPVLLSVYAARQLEVAPSQPVAAAALVLLTAASLPVTLAWLLLLVERPQRPPGLLDHVRRCIWLYAAVAAVVALLVISSFDEGGIDELEEGGALAVLIGVYSLYAALVDALVLLAKRWRNRRLSPGGHA